MIGSIAIGGALKARLEVEIQDLLRSGMATHFLADELVKRWIRGELSNHDVHTTCQFLIHCGYISTLFNQIGPLLSKVRDIPWSDVIEALLNYSNQLDDTLISQFLDGLDSENLSTELAFLNFSPNFNSYSDRAKQKLRNSWSEKREEKVELLLSMLKAKKIELAESTLHSLLCQFPGTPEREKLEQLIQNAKDERRKKNKSLEDPPIQKVLRRLQLENQEMLERARQEIIPSILKTAKENVDIAYDLAVGLHIMGANAEALEALGSCPTTKSVDFLRLEILLSSRRFLELLYLADEVAETYASDAETITATIYLKARALWGLKKHKDAISLMTDIVSQNPDFRSAHSLLLRWKGLEHE